MYRSMNTGVFARFARGLNCLIMGVARYAAGRYHGIEWHLLSRVRQQELFQGRVCSWQDEVCQVSCPVVESMMYRSYPKIGRHDQLRYEGRELLGNNIYWTEKRDGQNICIYSNDNGYILAGSHRMDLASDDIMQSIFPLPAYRRACDIVQDEPNLVVYLEHIMKGAGPTRIEKPKKNACLVLIDIFDSERGRYFHYNALHQYAHKYRLPIVKLFGISEYRNLESLKIAIDAYLKFCRRHKREGVVGKVYDTLEQIFFKEKIDLPKLKKARIENKTGIVYPLMPEDKITTAIERALHECRENGEDIRNPKLAMPRINTHLVTEAKEHFYSVPKDMFQRYRTAISGVS